ncbi:hypothetical protein [Streptomyces sp. NPDC002644]
MSRGVRRARTVHADIAARARRQPRRWTRLREYNSSASAQVAMREIRTGERTKNSGRTPFQPPHHWQTRAELSDYGCVVYVRYVGRPSDTR